MKFRSLVLSSIMLCIAIHSFGQDKKEKETVKYGKTIWAIAPISFSEISKGVGISYERALDDKGLVAIWIPVMFGFRSYNDNTYNYPYASQTNDAVYGHFYAMPGIKIYPTGSFDRCKYSIGPNLVFATGDRPADYNLVYNSGPTQNFLKLGFMLNNSLNLNPTSHLYMGIDFGFGITYLYQQAGVNSGTTGLFHFAFRIGYRS